MSNQLRIAWIGGPGHGGGVGGFCRQLLTGLLHSDVDLTLFSGNTLDDFHEVMGPAGKNAKVFSHPPAWEWDRWYSRNSLGVFLSSFWARRRSYSHVVKSLMQEHRRQPFDVVLQFSQTELFELRGQLDKLPPLVLFPCVHAAGELRWHRSESRYARRTESFLQHYVVRANLMQRAYLQKKCCRAVHGVIGMSRRFNELLAYDYGVDPVNQAVVYQPIDPIVHVKSEPPPTNDRPIKLLYVGRISVRKGMEMLVELSHRLDDLAEQVEMTIVGGASFWSDYRRGLDDLNPQVATYVGSKEHSVVKELMTEADVLLIPSHYEPGGIVVAEALSHGCQIVASDEIGSAEPLPDSVCRRFPRGDNDRFEAETRALITDLQNSRHAMRAEAIQTAQQCFDPTRAQDHLLTILRRAAAGEAIAGEPNTSA